MGGAAGVEAAARTTMVFQPGDGIKMHCIPRAVGTWARET